MTILKRCILGLAVFVLAWILLFAAGVTELYSVRSSMSYPNQFRGYFCEFEMTALPSPMYSRRDQLDIRMCVGGEPWLSGNTFWGSWESVGIDGIYLYSQDLQSPSLASLKWDAQHAPILIPTEIQLRGTLKISAFLCIAMTLFAAIRRGRRGRGVCVCGYPPLGIANAVCPECGLPQS